MHYWTFAGFFSLIFGLYIRQRAPILRTVLNSFYFHEALTSGLPLKNTHSDVHCQPQAPAGTVFYTKPHTPPKHYRTPVLEKGKQRHKSFSKLSLADVRVKAWESKVPANLRQPDLEAGKPYPASGSHCQSHLDHTVLFHRPATNTELLGERTPPWLPF